MAEKEKEITLSISINLVNSVDSEKNCVISKAIRKFRVGDTWFDVFDSVVESSCKTDQFAEDLWDGRSFEKSATVKVSSSTNEEEVFNASPFDQISVLHEFDKKLKYVTINIKSDEKKDTFTHASTSKENVFTKMMTDRQKTKPASKLSVDKPRFTGDGLHGTVFVRLQLCCSTPVEFAYYASTHIAADKNICCYCATPEATERDTESLEKFRVVLPRCQNCKKTKPVIKRLPKK